MTEKSDVENPFAVAKRDLLVLRNARGHDTPVGHRCSNIVEMLENLPPGPEDRIEYLTSDETAAEYDRLFDSIRKEAADLERLLQAAQ